VTVLVSTFRPEVFLEERSLASCLPLIGQSYHALLVSVSSAAAFERVVVVAVLVFCVLSLLAETLEAGGFTLAATIGLTVLSVISSVLIPLSNMAVLKHILRSHLVWYAWMLNLLAIPTAWAYRSFDRGAYVVYLSLSLVCLPVLDGYKSRRLVTFYYAASSVTSTISLFLKVFGLCPELELVTLRVLGGEVSLYNRAIGAGISWAIVYLRHAVFARKHPDRFCFMPAARLAKVPRASAEVLLLADHNSHTRHAFAARAHCVVPDKAELFSELSEPRRGGKQQTARKSELPDPGRGGEQQAARESLAGRLLAATRLAVETLQQQQQQQQQKQKQQQQQQQQHLLRKSSSSSSNNNNNNNNNNKALAWRRFRCSCSTSSPPSSQRATGAWSTGSRSTSRARSLASSLCRIRCKCCSPSPCRTYSTSTTRWLGRWACPAGSCRAPARPSSRSASRRR
jgi:hypothetical protein